MRAHGTAGGDGALSRVWAATRVMKNCLHSHDSIGSTCLMIVLSDASTIRNLLETDRPWSAYPLGDLAPGLFEQGSWYCPSAGDQALVLLFRGFTPPVLFTLGSPEVLGR